MEEKGIDLDLLEYVVAPTSVQIHSPEKWIEFFDAVLARNTGHLFHDAQHGPACRKCLLAADTANLLTHERKGCFRRHEVDLLLCALLEALDKREGRHQ